jgi:hypothetical protein
MKKIVRSWAVRITLIAFALAAVLLSSSGAAHASRPVPLPSGPPRLCSGVSTHPVSFVKCVALP